MDLASHYSNLYERASKEILQGFYVLDDQIDSVADDRMGITLLIRPSEPIKGNFHSFLNEVEALEPAQYYYPVSDMHITVMSIISCYSGFDLAAISVPAYVELVKQSLSGIQAMEIHFKGITASNAAVMVQGFPADNSLNDLRDRLRINFKNAGLQQSIDSRYSLLTAHATVMRFRKELRARSEFVRLLEKYRQHDFGKFKVEKLELVYNDWYQRDKFVKKLHTFSLK